MRKIEKHQFEAVSLLTVENGLLDITIVPALNQPNWIVPSNLIISIDDYDEHIWTYLWRNQEVAVYSLISRNETPDKIIVLEGNTDVHRIGLLTKGALKEAQVKISDVKDAILTDFTSDGQAEFEIIKDSVMSNSSLYLSEKRPTEEADISATATEDEYTLPYVYQTVVFEGEVYIVPNLDELAHHLVDLDSY